ncbi:hypothetical protein Purlil1_13473 [Purpureocillium lilacinum]|uniref:Vegetative incompatibility protein HET-E-1 n=1 Tax=Purpureocillium lilacinum TaxID=33203 RepID=A0ABR0BE64_PURLI|nr:hypothetical protein Purlil1_13473 [Purpureocillium lilacinum]
MGRCTQLIPSQDEGPKKLFEFLDDAMRFVQAYSFAIENAPLQVYSSLLVFSPSRSKIRVTFGSQIPRWISLQPKVNDSWGLCMQTLEGHDRWASSVAFSPDSTLVASGSGDKTIRLWGVATGECVQTLEGHDDSVTSVAFSPDSTLVASGSNDETIRLWRVATGECVQTLEGHDDSVTSVAFSPDSTLVASGSDDKTIRLWRVATGECVQTLEGHDSLVSSVAFSPDSTLVASGSDDKTIRLWRVATGECVQTLEGHNRWVSSVAFSPDSTLVASGSGDKTIRLWRVATGECVQTLEGHDSLVYSVAFSPDSALVASGSYDKTIRLWRVATGKCVQTLQVRFSPLRLSFGHDRSNLMTDRGAITTQVETPGCCPTGAVANAMDAVYAPFGISDDETWITWTGKKLLWLPKEYRPAISAVSGSNIVIGCRSGRVLVSGFSRQNLSEKLTGHGK